MRNNFTAKTKEAAHKRSGGICECHLIPHVFKVACGLPLGIGNTFYEHIDPDEISGRNDLENCAVLTKTCWAFKTKTFDLPRIARGRRVRRGAMGIKKKSRFACSKDSGWKRKVDGTVVRR